MKNNFLTFIISVIIIAVLAIALTLRWSSDDKANIESKTNTGEIVQMADYVKDKEEDKIKVLVPDKKPEVKKLISEPITNALSRLTKKHFWINVSPWDSPINPEKFSWYHTWADFEITSREANAEVSVYAICSWPLLLKKTAIWYWGIAVQKCKINNSEVSVIYWHLKFSSITWRPKQDIDSGQKLWILGKWNSDETWWERKHLHLSIYKWVGIDTRGYVNSKNSLKDWVDVGALLEWN
ncbi:MAG: hypothetical protein ACD_3C00144G0003 [uncultured bacterium (gcode 4)]|uniref:Peptidase M23 domain-containing protein n=1 Tax=uncultured bacterium (gcode 4) TaxID=1234023 RepID=K2GC66_9BACT|nr:MAG: hypothetical protein ACD_3C00144G0003 [uncultured bacterium (gcode 4)]